MTALPRLFTKEDAFNDLFLKGSQESGTPYAVLKGIAARESGYDEKAYRYEQHRGEASYGLTQTLASTARDVGFQGDPAELFDPATSIKYGGRALRAFAEKYSSLPDTIAAYNMGFPRKITATTQLIATVYGYPYEYRTKPPAGWVYANEPYVRRVISYIAYYQAKEKNDVARAQAVYALIKKGDYDAAYKMAQPVYWTAGKKDAPPAKLLIGAALGLAALGVILFKDN